MKKVVRKVVKKNVTVVSEEGYVDITVPDVENYRTTKAGSNISLASSIKNTVTDSNRDFRKSNAAAEAAAEAASLAVAQQKLLEKQKAEAASLAVAQQKLFEKQKADSKEHYRKSIAALYQKRIDGDGGDNSEGNGGKGKSPLGALKAFGIIYAIFKLTEKLLSIGKMIYDALVGISGKAMAAIMTGQSLGMSGMDVLAQGNFARSKGMSEDVFAKAEGSVQSKFGNITSLDEGALGKLALVLGSDISRLVKSGIGGENPDKLLDMIITGFQNKALSGVNSIGQQVGMPAAIKELTSYLAKIDPNWAEIFARKNLDATSSTLSKSQRNAARGTNEQWMNSFNNNPESVNSNDIALAASMKALADEINGLWKAITDGILLKLAGQMGDTLSFLKNSLYFMMSPEGKAKMVEENVKINTDRLKEMDVSDAALSAQQGALRDQIFANNPNYKGNSKLLDKDIEFAYSNGVFPQNISSADDKTMLALQQLYAITSAKHEIEKHRKDINNDKSKYNSYNEAELLSSLASGSDAFAEGMVNGFKGSIPSGVQKILTERNRNIDTAKGLGVETGAKPGLGALVEYRKESEQIKVAQLIAEARPGLLEKAVGDKRLDASDQIVLSIQDGYQTIYIKDSQTGETLATTGFKTTLSNIGGVVNVGDYTKDMPKYTGRGGS